MAKKKTPASTKRVIKDAVSPKKAPKPKGRKGDVPRGGVSVINPPTL